jgi:hypothetical protein
MADGYICDITALLTVSSITYLGKLCDLADVRSKGNHISIVCVLHSLHSFGGKLDAMLYDNELTVVTGACLGCAARTTTTLRACS